ncbi:MAG: Zn-ribbon domain-containing OB-fold protein [Actinobacteria bacterium]|jgi:uncharacterized OB-fold protein|nr:MAG: Zn-ribbon domain-containing OB-fold protein [Actinomycetota bacterium]
MSELRNAREISLPMDASFRWSVGEYMERFFAELGEEKLVGIRCPSCRKVFVPPRMVCEYCFAETEGWVEVGPRATVVAFTVAHVEVDPKSGGLRDLEVPRIVALIRPDGADSAFVHRVYEVGPEDMQVGMKLEPVWTAEPCGYLFDLPCFRPVKGGR